MTDHIVVGDRVVLDAGFYAARAHLELLARSGLLERAAEAAYGEGITALVRLAGPAAGLTRLARTRLDEPASPAATTHVGLRWDAIAADGSLFTALDADLMLAPAGERAVVLALAGAFWPQPGPGGAGLDRALVRECAAVAVRGFLSRVASVLVHPAGTATSPGAS